MGLFVENVKIHQSGRAEYRRAFPPKLLPYIAGKENLRWSEFKRSLGRPNEPEFHARLGEAKREYQAITDAARRKRAGAFDPLTPELIDYLIAVLKADDLALDAEVRWLPRPTERKRRARSELRETVLESLEEALELRALGDIGQISCMWARHAEEHATASGFTINSGDAEFPEYVRAFHEAHIFIWQAILRRLDGEDIPTPAEPKWTEPAQKIEPLPLLEAFDGYAASQQFSAGVRTEWRRYIQHLVDFLGHDDARSLTSDDLMRWRDHLIETPTRYGKARKRVTVKDKYLTAIRGTLKWAVEERKLTRNVAESVKVRVPRETKLREKDFNKTEAEAILRASLETPSGKLSAPYVRARRWIPWLCAYTGARVNELSQLRTQDVHEEDGAWFLTITPEAGTVKTRIAREVPVHAHLIEQGFLAMVRSLPSGPIFYDPAQRRVDSDDSRHFKKVGERLAQWVRRDVGIADPAIKPNHAWRHLFKTRAIEAGISERVADAIQGHAPGSVSRNYGQVSLKSRADAIALFPRFDVP